MNLFNRKKRLAQQAMKLVAAVDEMLNNPTTESDKALFAEWQKWKLLCGRGKDDDWLA